MKYTFNIETFSEFIILIILSIFYFYINIVYQMNKIIANLYKTD
jgi:hypothetical protein